LLFISLFFINMISGDLQERNRAGLDRDTIQPGGMVYSFFSLHCIPFWFTF
jgi:hypothetical protein